MLLMVSANSATSSAVNDGQARQRQFDLMRRQLRQTRAEMRRRLGERDRQIAEQTQKIAEQERSLAELNRRIVEYDQRFDDIAAEVARVRVADVKQKRISPSDASSSGDSSLPSQTTVLSASETGSGCHPLSASVTNKTNTKKRRASPDSRQSKHGKNSDVGPPATKTVRYLRSGRQVTYK